MTMPYFFFFFQKTSQYIGVTKTSSCKNPWQASIYTGGKSKHCGSFKTEIEAAKRVNSICKKYGMKLKNAELSDEEENFTWPLPPKKVNIFLYIFFFATLQFRFFFLFIQECSPC